MGVRATERHGPPKKAHWRPPAQKVENRYTYEDFCEPLHGRDSIEVSRARLLWRLRGTSVPFRGSQKSP